jgi:hypothetical protein
MEVAVLVQRIRFEPIRPRLNQLLEVGILPNGDKGLHVELKAQRRGKADVRTGSEVKRLTR